MSKAEEKMSVLNDSRDKHGGIDGVLVALVIGLITIGILIFLWRRSRVVRRGVCLVGLCESGKTLIFSQLVLKKAVESFTSIAENSGLLNFENKGSLKIVDIPGHERVRQRFFDAHKGSARGVVFVIDSLSITKDIRDVAEYLYTILSDSVVCSNRPLILILCNKQDHALAKGAQIIRSLLEKELNLLRNTKTNQLEAISDAGGKKQYLGREGKDFEFSDLQPSFTAFKETSSLRYKKQLKIALDGRKKLAWFSPIIAT
nr:EOG090X0C7N [Ilyocryptus agilis]